MNVQSRKRSLNVSNLSNFSDSDVLTESEADESCAAKKIMLDAASVADAPLAEPEADLCNPKPGPIAPVAAKSEEVDCEPLMSEEKPKRKLRRSVSVPNLLETLSQKVIQRRATTTITQAPPLPRPPLNESTRTLFEWDSFDGSRPHEFLQVRVSKIFASTECAVCNHNVKFGSVGQRCKVCKLTFHDSCLATKSIPIPCLPRKETPKQTANKGRLRLGDYCPDARPMLPHLIGHCANFLERCQVPDDLYRTADDISSVIDLLNEFKRRKGVPRMTDASPNVVAGCITRFLKELREPLIPTTYTSEFVAASKSPNADEQMVNLLQNLPNAHCDTLTYLVRHWKRLGEASFNGCLDLDFLCHELGPLILGARHEPRRCAFSDEDAAGVLRTIFHMPADSLNDLIVIQPSDPNTPGVGRKASQQSNDFSKFHSSTASFRN